MKPASERDRPRVLITGGAGFVGSHLIDRYVSDGWVVVALDDLSTGKRSNVEHLTSSGRIKLIEGSVLDETLVDRHVERSDLVVHLAAAVGVELIVSRPLQSMLTNIRGTEVVLAAADRWRVKTLIASTSEIYGKRLNGRPFKEEDDRVLGSTTKLRWSYSVSKSVDEILAFIYYRERGLPITVARLFNTVGPRQTGRYGMVVPRFVSQALRGQPLTVYGDGTQSRVFTFVGDVVEALIRLTASGKADGQVFNVAGHQEITMQSLAQKVIDMVGTASRIEHIPYEQVYGDGFEGMARRIADTSKLERVTGYRCRTTLDDTLALVIEHLRHEVRS